MSSTESTTVENTSNTTSTSTSKLPVFILNKGCRFVFHKGINTAAKLCHNKVDDLNPNANGMHMEKMHSAITNMVKWAKLVQPANETPVEYRPAMKADNILNLLGCIETYAPFMVLVSAAKAPNNDARWNIAKQAFDTYFKKGDNGEGEQQEATPEPAKPEPKTIKRRAAKAKAAPKKSAKKDKPAAKKEEQKVEKGNEGDMMRLLKAIEANNKIMEQASAQSAALQARVDAMTKQ